MLCQPLATPSPRFKNLGHPVWKTLVIERQGHRYRSDPATLPRSAKTTTRAPTGRRKNGTIDDDHSCADVAPSGLAGTLAIVPQGLAPLATRLDPFQGHTKSATKTVLTIIADSSRQPHVFNTPPPARCFRGLPSADPRHSPARRFQPTFAANSHWRATAACGSRKRSVPVRHRADDSAGRNGDVATSIP